MEIYSTIFSEVKLLKPNIYSDSRGHFYEGYHAQRFNQALGQEITFVQDNHSYSHQGVVRGLHYQIQRPQGKLVRTLSGSILDVVVDLRRSSNTFGQWMSQVISAENQLQIWIPIGFAHGFAVLSKVAEVLYKTTDYYAPEHERCIRWDDPTLAIDWKLDAISPILSIKDESGILFKDAELF